MEKEEFIDIIELGKAIGLTSDQLVSFMGEKPPMNNTSIPVYLSDLINNYPGLTVDERVFRAFAHGYALGMAQVMIGMMTSLLDSKKRPGDP